MITKRIVFEIGANTGSDTGNLKTADSLVFAFEPNHYLYDLLVKNWQNDPDVFILPFAVDLKNTMTHFNISEAGDRGTSSLYDYSPEMLMSGIGQHPVFQAGFTHKQKVITVRLDTFMSMLEIPRIDYLHIDAQGNDFRVLQSLGDRVKDLKYGRCECTYKNPLYTGAGVVNDYETCIQWLEAKGFSHEVDYVHQNETEIDVRFWR